MRQIYARALLGVCSTIKNLSKGRSEFIQHESYIPTHNYRIRFNFTNIKLISDIFKVIVIMSR